MGENLLRRFGEELALFVIGRLVERGCNRSRLGWIAQLTRRGPVGRTGVERIQNPVAPVGAVEPFRELSGRVVDDGGFAPLLNLLEDLYRP